MLNIYQMTSQLRVPIMYSCYIMYTIIINTDTKWNLPSDSSLMSFLGKLKININFISECINIVNILFLWSREAHTNWFCWTWQVTRLTIQKEVSSALSSKDSLSSRSEMMCAITVLSASSC